MNDSYLVKLINQYKSAVGITTDEVDEKDFNDYLYRYVSLTDKYISYEEFYGYKLNSSFIAETDKGYIDSIASSPMLVISPYADTLGLKPAKLMTGFYKPLVLINDELFNPDDIKTFITQNPYDYSLIGNWDRLANEYNIGVGVYGYIDDKDREDKLIMLSYLYDKLNKVKLSSYDISFENDTENDIYYGLVTAKKNKMIKVKSK